MTDQPPPPPPDNGSRAVWPAIRAILRIRIVAGLLMVIPIWVTWVVVRFVFDTARSATEPLAQRVADKVIEKNWEILPNAVREYFTLLPVTPERAQAVVHDIVVPIVAVLLTLFILYVLGMLTANVFGRRIIRVVERAFEKVPMVKTIYRSTKQIVMTIGGADSMKLNRVVIIETPRPGMKRIAFLTSVMTDSDTGRQLANVFIPYTPYVTTGYMQIVPIEDVSETNWTVEEAVKLIMSGGILSPSAVPFDRHHPVRSLPAAPEPATAGQARGKLRPRSVHATDEHT